MPGPVPAFVELPPVAAADVPAVLAAVAHATRAGLAGVVLRDAPVAGPPASPRGVDPSVLAGRLAATPGIGVVVAASSGGHAPYNLARRVASLARLTGGSAGLLLRDGGVDAVTRAAGGAADPASAFAEYADLLRALWASFPHDALVGDVRGGRLADTARLAPARFEGRTYRVAGALNVPLDPAERPVLLADAHAAVVADAVVVRGATDPAGDGPARLVAVDAGAARAVADAVAAAAGDAVLLTTSGGAGAHVDLLERVVPALLEAGAVAAVDATTTLRERLAARALAGARP